MCFQPVSILQFGQILAGEEADSIRSCSRRARKVSFPKVGAPKIGEIFDGGSSMKPNRVVFVCAIFTLVAGVVSLGARIYAQDKAEALHKIVRFGDLKWTPVMKGCDLAAVSGDPNADGSAFVIRIRCADGSKIPPHWHPTDENVTVLKGTFLIGMGETFDETKLQTMNVGNFISMPKEMRHFAASKGESIVQVHGAGPFKVNWVNPADVIPPDAPAAKP